jgi:hypothetical protein
MDTLDAVSMRKISETIILGTNLQQGLEREIKKIGIKDYSGGTTSTGSSKRCWLACIRLRIGVGISFRCRSSMTTGCNRTGVGDGSLHASLA